MPINFVAFALWNFHTGNLFLAHYMLSLNDDDILDKTIWCRVIALQFLIPVVFFPPLGMFAFCFFVEVENKCSKTWRTVTEATFLFVWIGGCISSHLMLSSDFSEFKLKPLDIFWFILYLLWWIHLSLFTLMRGKRTSLNIFHPVGWILLVSIQLKNF